MSEEPKQNFLDLSKTQIRTSHQLESALSKVSDLRLRTEKLREEDIVSSILASKAKNSLSSEGRYPFLDPVPTSMIDVDIQELSQVDIDWKMLTLARPGNKFDEDIFSRYVQLAKLSKKARAATPPPVARTNVVLNTRLGFRSRSIEDSGDETNHDNINEFCYDYFSRQQLAEEEDGNEELESLDQEKETSSGARRRPFARKQNKKTDSKSNHLTVPGLLKSRSRSCTPEIKGRKSRSVTPSPKTPVTTRKTKSHVKKKKNGKKKASGSEGEGV